MSVVAMEQKPLFTDDQLIQASDAAKKFGATQDLAQTLPLFVTNKQGKIKTVIVGYELYKKLYARLVELEEAENDRILGERLAEIEKDPIGNSVSWRSVRRSDA